MLVIGFLFLVVIPFLFIIVSLPAVRNETGKTQTESLCYKKESLSIRNGVSIQLPSYQDVLL